MNKTKVGVIGIGHLGKLHTSLYRDVEHAEIVGIYDIDQEKARRVGREFNVVVYEDKQSLYDAVDAVNIVTPTTTHFDVAKSALHQGCHLFIEKPITATEHEAKALIDLAEKKNKIIQVGHIERFNGAIIALSDVKLQPLFIESHRLASFNPRGTDVAVILDLMIHDLDLILSLVRSEPQNIEASGVGVLSESIDIANARIQFANGCVANVTASRISTKKMRKMRIFQPNAYISCDFVDGISEIYYTTDSGHSEFKDGTMAFSLGHIDAMSGAREIKYNKLQRTGINPLRDELASFVRSIQENKPAAVSAAEGLSALRLANRVLSKIDEHTRFVTGRSDSHG